MKLEFAKLFNEDKADLQLCIDAYWKAGQDRDTIRAAYQARVAAQRKYSEDRAATLREIVKDTSRSQAARDMAAAELAALEGNTYPPTAAEQESYAAAMAAQRQAISDIRQAKEKAEVTLKALQKQLDDDRQEIRSERGNVQWLANMLTGDKGLTL